MNNSNNISAVIITKNEKANIQRCIESLSWADEIVVYDSGSTDDTVAIAKKLGAVVTVGEWLGFGLTKKFAADLAKNDWIFSIDADEVVSLELKNEILEKLSHLDENIAYAVPRISNYLGRWIRYGGWYPDHQVRLFNKKINQWSNDLIHEKVKSKTTEKFTSSLNHYVFRNISHQVVTNDRYSSLQANDMKKNGKEFSWFHFLTKPTVKFIECYILKLGFLDGWVGYVIARSAAYSVFLKWAKMKELK